MTYLGWICNLISNSRYQVIILPSNHTKKVRILKKNEISIAKIFRYFLPQGVKKCISWGRICRWPKGVIFNVSSCPDLKFLMLQHETKQIKGKKWNSKATHAWATSGFANFLASLEFTDSIDKSLNTLRK